MSSIFTKFEDFTNNPIQGKYDYKNYQEEEEDIKEDDRDINYMNKSNIMEILEHANGIKKMLEEGFELDEWAKDHISKATDDISEVYHYMKSQN